jgi:hypothetical protein
MTRKTAYLLTMTAFTIGGLALAAPAAAQDVRRGPNNTLEVHFPGPCTVYYDRNGNRTYDTPPCGRVDRERADAAVRAYLGGYGRPDYNPGYNPGYPNSNWGYGGPEPRVRINSGGWGTVDLRNGCIVTFNRDGRRIYDTRPCNTAMRSYAQRVFEQHSYGGGGYRPGYGYARPDLSVYGNRITVRMTGTNCTYIYTTGGNHLQSIGSQCDSRLRDIANEAVRDWRNRYR